MLQVLLLYMIPDRISLLRSNYYYIYGDQHCWWLFEHPSNYLPFVLSLESCFSICIPVGSNSGYISKSGKYVPYLSFLKNILIELKEISDYYRIRFNIGFYFRHKNLLTELISNLNRNLNNQHFYFRASPANVYLPKIKASEKEITLFIASVKVLFHTVFLIRRFAFVFGIIPNAKINQKMMREKYEFAIITA